MHPLGFIFIGISYTSGSEEEKKDVNSKVLIPEAPSRVIFEVRLIFQFAVILAVRVTKSIIVLLLLHQIDQAWSQNVDID